MSDYLTITEKLLKTTRAMLASAQAAEWAKVLTLQQERQMLMRDLDLSKGVAGEYGKNVAANLQETLQINEQLIEMSVHAKGDLEKSIGSVQRGRKANLAYRVLG